MGRTYAAGAPDTGRVAGVDPIFETPEPVERPVRTSVLLFQFFLVPLMIVVAAVGVYLFFGVIADSRNTPTEYLDAVMSGGDNVQKQSAHQLAVLLADERARVDRSPGGKPPFWEEAGFREKLRRAFVESFPDRSVERRQFLALALGRVGEPEYLPTLVEHAAPTVGGLENPPQVRRAVVAALSDLRVVDAADADAKVAALVPLASDADESVRNLAVGGLSRRDVPAAREALTKALGDASPYVQANAAAALARWGDPAGAAWVERLLDPAEVDRMIAVPSRTGGGETPTNVDPQELRQRYLANGIHGAMGLGDERLKARVQALTQDRDDRVRELARFALEHWPKKI